MRIFRASRTIEQCVGMIVATICSYKCHATGPRLDTSNAAGVVRRVSPEGIYLRNGSLRVQEITTRILRGFDFYFCDCHRIMAIIELVIVYFVIYRVLEYVWITG